MPEVELIEACAHNDLDSQKVFYDRYGRVVMGICMRYAGCEKEAGAMTQYVFRKIFEDINRCSLKEDIGQWIEQKVIWSAIQYLHCDKHKYFIAKTTVYVENKPVYSKAIDEVNLPDEMNRQLYLAALQELTPSYRILYNLTYIDEVMTEEIIKNLQIAEETYNVEIDEAKYQFKKLLTKRLNEQNLQ